MLNGSPLPVQIFEGFSLDEQDELRSIIEVFTYPAGETILRQSQQGVHLFILVTGEVEITHVPYDGPELTIGKLTSGGVFGWSSILGRKTYSSSVFATTDSRVYRIAAYKLQRFCEQHQESGMVLLEKIAMSVAQQPAKAHDQIMHMLRAVIACPEGKNPEE